MRKESGGAQRLAGEQQGPEQQPLEHGFTASPVHAHHAVSKRVQCPGPQALEM